VKQISASFSCCSWGLDVDAHASFPGLHGKILTSLDRTKDAPGLTVVSALVSCLDKCFRQRNRCLSPNLGGAIWPEGEESMKGTTPLLANGQGFTTPRPQRRFEDVLGR
jgi:hypothetical protein